MSKAALSIFVFGLYLLINGLGFLFIPNTMLGLFGIATTTEPWIRLIGMLLLVLAFYYIQTSRQENKAFFPLTIPARLWVFVCIVALVIFNIAETQMVIFASVDLLGTIWTWWALRS